MNHLQELSLVGRLLCAFGFHDLPVWGPVREDVLVDGEPEDIQQRACLRCRANFWRSA